MVGCKSGGVDYTGGDMEKDMSNSVGIVQTEKVRVVEAGSPLGLQSGKSLGPIDVAYETYGRLSEAGDNVILICHALSGNAHVAGYKSAEDKRPGWWDNMVGPGKAIDTNKYFVICSNNLGGCSGTTGPSEVNPATGKHYGLDFPIITISDMVEVQKLLLDKLGIKKLLGVIGGSMGGMMVLQWAISYPDFVESAVCVASTSRLGPQSIAFDAVGRNAILADVNFSDGQYHDGKGPNRGLAIARMIGHITYLSEEGMRQKFGRELRRAEDYSYDFDSEFAVETYLDYKGQTFIERFDANSYLYITKAMDYFDLKREYGSLEEAFKGCRSRFLILSFTGDWLFPPAQSEELVDALACEGKDVSYCNIQSGYGHDAFLLEPDVLGALIKGFFDSTYRKLSGAGGETPQKMKSRRKAERFEDAKRVRVDYELIDSLVEAGSKVLDVGSGDGGLLIKLIEDKNVTCQGIELDQELVIHSIERGLSIIHRDIERGLSQYVDKSFDYVILSQTLQTLKEPEKVLKELLRVARKVIVSFPNFGHWRCRFQLMLVGRAPVTKQLPFAWHNSPNIHFLSLKDFEQFCEDLGVRIESKIALGKSSVRPIVMGANIFSTQAIYVTSMGSKD
jgi:homoserine O-acetyltransferase